MTDYFRVTVEDLALGTKKSVDVADGDFIFIPFGTCHLAKAETVRGEEGDSHVQLVVRGHHPAGPKREVPS